MLFKKAKESDCELVLPLDFQTATKIKREQVLAQASGQAVDDRPTSRSQEENSGSNTKDKAGKKAPAAQAAQPEPTQEPPKEIVPSEEAKIWIDAPNLHWSDVVIRANTCNIVDLEE